MDRIGLSAGQGSATPSRLLRTLAERVRGLRRTRGWSRETLAQRAGLSARYLARVETGSGNISVLRLETLARALDTTADALVRPPEERSGVFVLVGLRGAGKSTVGPLLAQRLAVPFVEMDSLILESCGLPLDQLFELHGERYYRRLERETLQRILGAGRPAIVAAAGGVVNEPSTWEHLCERARVIWLRANPEDHWNRVVAQGDRRPMADNPDAMEELRAMLEARRKRYSLAWLTVDTSSNTASEVAAYIAERIEELDA